jgi:hypothetical protein
MEKGEFIEKAPLYYALGIAVTLGDAKGNAKTVVELDNILSTSRTYLDKEPLINQATKFLYENQALEIVPDDFGPTLYKASGTLAGWIENVAPDKFPLFRKYRDSGSRSWLRSALSAVNSQYDELEVMSDDFADNVIEVKWEPIPLDRADKQLQTATKAVDSAIQAIESDNGYAVNVPRERDYVLSNLKTIQNALKEKTQIYWIELKTFGIDPLTKVIKRFGPAAVGIAALAARKALFEWLKTNFSKALDWM